MTATSRLIPVPEWNKHHPWPPQGGLRHLIFNQKTNGFGSAFKRVGRRVLVDEVEFFACVDRQNQPDQNLGDNQTNKAKANQGGAKPEGIKKPT